MDRTNLKSRGRRTRHSRYLTIAPTTSFQHDGRSTDSGADTAGGQAQPLRPVNMNTYTGQPTSRQTPRLQNTQKTGLGNGNAGAGWAFGSPLSSGPFGGLGNAPGLGQGRPGQLSGFAQVMGGGGQGPIDMSDFPSLAGSVRPQQANSGGWNSNVIRQPAQQQQAPQPPIQQQQQPRAPSTAPSHHSLDQFDGQRSQAPSSERNGRVGGDEFPPLGGQVNGDSSKHTNGFGGFSVMNSMPPQPSGQQSSMPLTMDELTASLESHVHNQPPPQARTQGAPPGLGRPNQAAAPSGKLWADLSKFEKFGLAGLNKMLETSQALQVGGEIDPTLPTHIRNSVALNMGHDLSDLGMDLNSTEPLHKTFHPFPDMANMGGPFDSRTRNPIPEFAVPAAYYVTNVPSMESRMTSFNDETLFMIFFGWPKDVKQELAAMELTRREWRWHMILHQWLRPDVRELNNTIAQDENAVGLSTGLPPVRLDDRSEKGVYIFWNPYCWQRERREFVLVYSELENRFNTGYNGPMEGAPVHTAFGAK